MFWRSVVLPIVVLDTLLELPKLLCLAELDVPLSDLLGLVSHILAWVVTKFLCEKLQFWWRLLPGDDVSWVNLQLLAGQADYNWGSMGPFDSAMSLVPLLGILSG